MRRVLAVTSLALLTPTGGPAHAAVYPVCATALANARAAESATCSSDNTPQIAGAVSFRTATVEVLAGVVRATVRCGFGVWERSASIEVSGPQPRSVPRVSEEADPSCRTELVALHDNTTAAVVSTFSYSFIGPQ